MNNFDVIVIGAGPGGSAAAISAVRAGARVLLLERGSFPRHKVCGEFVSAESLGLLASLLGTPATALLSPAIRIGRARLFLDGKVVESPIKPSAASIARFDLDAALWQAAASVGVECHDGTTVTRVAQRGREHRFRVSSSSGEFDAGAVVDATGRWSNLTPRVEQTETKWLGLKGHFRETDPSQSVDLYFIDGGYCGVQPVDVVDGENRGSRVNACAMVRADRATELSQVFGLHPELRRRSEKWTALTDTVTTSPLIFRKPVPVRNGMLLVGDAAGFVDPFVGDGISLALQSGTLAAECLLRRSFRSSPDTLDDYARQYESELGPIFRASSTLRRLLALPAAIRRPALTLLKNSPKLREYIVKRTRKAS